MVSITIEFDKDPELKTVLIEMLRSFMKKPEKDSSEVRPAPSSQPTRPEQADQDAPVKPAVPKKSAKVKAPKVPLTNEQKAEILRLAGTGLNRRQIAKALKIDVHRVHGVLQAEKGVLNKGRKREQKPDGAGRQGNDAAVRSPAEATQVGTGAGTKVGNKIGNKVATKGPQDSYIHNRKLPAPEPEGDWPRNFMEAPIPRSDADPVLEDNSDSAFEDRLLEIYGKLTLREISEELLKEGIDLGPKEISQKVREIQLRRNQDDGGEGEQREKEREEDGPGSGGSLGATSSSLHPAVLEENPPQEISEEISAKIKQLDASGLSPTGISDQLYEMGLCLSPEEIQYHLIRAARGTG